MSSKQLNLGWTVTNIWYLGAFFLGIILVLIALLILTFNSDYLNSTKSKQGIMILAWVGFAMILVGIWTTLSSFYKVVKRIAADVRRDPKCSLFTVETAVEAARLLQSSLGLEENVDNLKKVAEANAYSAGNGVASTPSKRLIDATSLNLTKLVELK